MHKVLIADDDDNIRLLFEQTLEDLEDKGVSVLTAKDGQEALDAILSEKPELVFLDVMMPIIDGIDLCNKVKKEYSLENVHVIILSARGQDSDKRRGLAAGADLYMVKPFDPDVVIEKTREILKID